MNIKNKIALITGASRGIGKAIAENLIKYGVNVIGTSTTENGVKSINNYLIGHGKGVVMDLNDPDSIKFALNDIQINFGEIDILVNNAGIINDNIIIKMKDKEWNNVIETNLSSVFRLSKLVIRPMIKKRYGRIITIGSVIANIGNIGQINYAAAKAGLVGFSKSLAKEVASRGITVNVVSPGFIDTDMIKSLTNKQISDIIKIIPLKRLGKPKEVADAVIFLISDKASYITGETLHVNGGIYMI